MAESRTKKTLKNAVINISCQIAILITSFATRTLFIKLLGANYLGINGLFSNILSYLSLAELGFSSAIVYELYSLIANKNEENIAATINFYGKIYKIIALVVFVLGMALVPFLQLIVKFPEGQAVSHIKLYYVLFLLKSVMSYLFVYKSCILQADQKSYVVNSNSTFWQILTNILQLIFLWLTHLYLVYLLIQLLCQLFANINIYKISEKKYPFIKNNKAKLLKEEKNKIIDNVKSLFLSKIGNVFINNTTNILISIFVNTVVVGIYSNYTMIYGILKTLTTMLFGGLNAGIGNYIATNTKEASCKCFYMINFAQFWLFGFIFLALFAVTDDFIRLWIGEKYVLGNITCAVITITYFLEKISSAVWSFNYAAGMFKETKYVTIITGVLNLIFSTIFGKIWGLNGVLFGIIFVRVIFAIWFHPYILFKHYFNESLLKYFTRQGIYFVLFFLFMFVIYIVKLKININSWVLLISEILVVFIVINSIFYALFFKTEEYKDLIIRLKPILLRRGVKKCKN